MLLSATLLLCANSVYFFIQIPQDIVQHIDFPCTQTFTEDDVVSHVLLRKRFNHLTAAATILPKAQQRETQQERMIMEKRAA